MQRPVVTAAEAAIVDCVVWMMIAPNKYSNIFNFLFVSLCAWNFVQWKSILLIDFLLYFTLVK